MMDTNKQQDDALNQKQEAADQSQQQNTPHKGGIHNNALYAASMGRPATAQVDPHSNAGLAQTGTNNSYEGPLSAGSGGAAGTGYTSGQPGTGATIATDSDYDATRVTTKNDDQQTDRREDDIESTQLP